MTTKLSGKVALVTGGARGIGAAVARRLAADGADVAVNYRNNSDVAEALVKELVAKGRRAVAIQADVSDPAQIGRLTDETVAKLGKLDILVSNAGIEHFGRLESITPADFDRVYGTNTRGQLFAVQHAARHLGEGGRIVLTSSVSARKAVFYHTLYASSKAAVEAMVLNLAPELAKRGIGINAIAPGGTASDMSNEAAPHYVHPDTTLDAETAIRTMIALGRLARPDEIAAAVSFLVSEDASYMTGRTLLVDGGFF